MGILNDLVKEVIQIPRTVIQTTAKEVEKIITWDDEDEDNDR